MHAKFLSREKVFYKTDFLLYQLVYNVNVNIIVL